MCGLVYGLKWGASGSSDLCRRALYMQLLHTHVRRRILHVCSDAKMLPRLRTAVTDAASAAGFIMLAKALVLLVGAAPGRSSAPVAAFRHARPAEGRGIWQRGNATCQCWLGASPGRPTTCRR